MPSAKEVADARAYAQAQEEAGDKKKPQNISEAELNELDTLTNDQLRTRIRSLHQETQTLRSVENRSKHELLQLKREVELGKKRVKENNRLPYLVASIAEVLDLSDD